MSTDQIVCITCNKVKYKVDFNKKGLRGLNLSCKVCTREVSSKAYKKRVVDRKILLAEAAQEAWYRSKELNNQPERNIFKEYAEMFWDQVERENKLK